MGAVAHIDEYKKGRFYSEEFRGEMSWNGFENNVLLRNEGKDGDGVPQFVDVAMALGADDSTDARGVAIADFDNDGDLDLAINHNPGDNDDVSRRRAVYLRNDIGNRRSWVAVELTGTRSNRDAVGAEVRLTAAGLPQLQVVKAGNGYASQSSRRLYFGLGDAERVDRLTVRWPGGEEETFEDLPARSLVRITQGEGMETAALPGGGGVGAGSALEAAEAP